MIYKQLQLVINWNCFIVCFILLSLWFIVSWKKKLVLNCVSVAHLKKVGTWACLPLCCITISLNFWEQKRSVSRDLKVECCPILDSLGGKCFLWLTGLNCREANAAPVLFHAGVIRGKCRLILSCGNKHGLY